ncbi:MAG: UvrD-helicase domain-containing protein [Bifidobacteriaceae bacterium]|jgi:superfamily I DNA/RNA helicase|nr:UvrD-helicase domain-containing protein [Bifidobacteriaceae bacterium]
MPSTNEAVIAAAGSGKTKRLIDEAVADPAARVLITTYTRENLREIEARLWRDRRAVRCDVTAMTWFEFLLRECVKPYQCHRTGILTIRAINFDAKPPRYARETQFHQYYVDRVGNVYSDRVSALACNLDDLSHGAVVARIAECYDIILIDEMQDLAGWDLNLVERLMKSCARVVAVCDPRQAVYVTNYSSKNRSARGSEVVTWIEKRRKAGVLTVTEQSESFRCNQMICDYADALYPGLPSTTSRNTATVDWMGVHLVHVDDIDQYRDATRAQELRWDRRSRFASPDAKNMGEVKGAAYDRVLILPTGTIIEHLETGVDLKPVTRAKLYVAVTRARHSVGIVTTSRTTKSSLPFWAPARRERD